MSRGTDQSIHLLAKNLSDLELISFEELLSHKLTPGHLFFKRNYTKPLLIARAGEFIDSYFIDKFKKVGHKGFAVYMIKENSEYDFLRRLFRQLAASDFEDEKYQVRGRIVNWFKYIYWSGDKETSQLNLVLACTDIFMDLPDKVVREIQNTSIDIYNRSHLVASFSLLLAIIHGYAEFTFLKDLYNASFLLDYGVINKKFDYKIKELCQREKDSPGQAMQENKSFAKHASQSVNKILEEIPYFQKKSAFLNIIQNHHELQDGSGVPTGLTSAEISEIESIVIFVDHLFDFAPKNYTRNDAKAYFWNLWTKSEKAGVFAKLPLQRIKQRIWNCMGEGPINKKNKLVA